VAPARPAVAVAVADAEVQVRGGEGFEVLGGTAGKKGRGDWGDGGAMAGSGASSGGAILIAVRG